MEEFRANGQTYRWNPETKKIYVVSNADFSQNYTGKKADSLDEAKELVSA
jgi:hypothetical protein